MSKKQWAGSARASTGQRRILAQELNERHNDELNEEDEMYSLQSSLHNSLQSRGSEYSSASSRALSTRRSTRKDTSYQSPSKNLDASIWQMWEEMEGDEDGSGDVAMKTGELEEEKTRQNPLGLFVEDPMEGSVLCKTGITPVWCSGHGQNLGPDLDGHVTWEFDVIRRDGNMCIGIVVPSAVEGELDRRWDSKCFVDASFYWATTAGMLMNGQKIVKTLPTKRIPVFHFNPGDTVTVDLKVIETVIQARVISIDDAEMDLFNSLLVKFRLEPIDGKHGNMIENLPSLFCDEKVYEVLDFEMLDQTFCLRMRRECRVGDVLEFQFTGEMTISMRDITVGVFKAVPHVSAPAVCMSSLGDCVRLRAVWNDKDQELIDDVRANVVSYYKNSRGKYVELNISADAKRGVLDWVILKAIRTHDYDLQAAVHDTLEYVERNAGRLTERNAAEDRRRAQLNLLTHYSDDFKQKDPKISNINLQGGEWNPESIEDALSWQPHFDMAGRAMN